MILTDENGEILAVGLPKKVKEMVGGKAGATVSFKSVGGEVSGEKYSEIDYHWEFIREKPIDRDEAQEYADSVAYTSGTIPVSFGTSLHYAPPSEIPCKNCQARNDWDAVYCKICGTNLKTE